MTQGHILRAVACVVLGGFFGGCSGPTSRPAGGTSPAQSSVSYDGHYEGTVRLDGTASGFTPDQCTTNPRISLQVRNNEFSYVQPHPHAGVLTPQESTATYTASIAPDGTIHGTSGDLAGRIAGQVTGTHMAGQMSGVVCYYSFTADRA